MTLWEMDREREKRGETKKNYECYSDQRVVIPASRVRKRKYTLCHGSGPLLNHMEIPLTWVPGTSRDMASRG